MAEEHLEFTKNAFAFLRRLDNDQELSDRCERTDLEGRLQIAAEIGLPISEAQLRRTVRSWDFHSRWGKWVSAGRIASSQDDLPYLAADYEVSPEQVAAFERDGYVILRDVASREEILQYRPVIRQMIASHNTQAALRTEQLEDRAYLQVISLRVRDGAARRFVLATRFARIAADLLGVGAVRVYFDQALTKEPDNKISHWHQDHVYFPLDTDQIITIWIPLVDVSEEMGILAYAAGSHKDGSIGFKPDKQKAETYLPDFVAERGFTLSDSGPLAIGGVALHHGWLLHGALPNRGTKAREIVAVTYYPDGTRIAEPDNEFQRRATELVFPGLKPGDPAVSEITPLAYSANQHAMAEQRVAFS